MVYITCAVWLSLLAILCRDLQEKQDSLEVTVAALCGRWWKGTGLAGSNAAGILSRWTAPDFGKLFQWDCFLLWVSS